MSRFYAPNSDFYSEIQELTQILLRISEEKIGGWGLWWREIIGDVLFAGFGPTAGGAITTHPDIDKVLVFYIVSVLATPFRIVSRLTTFFSGGLHRFH